MVRKFNDFYPFQNKKINDDEIKKKSFQRIDETEIKLELINKIAYRNTISSLRKSGNEAIKETAINLLKSIDSEIELNNK